MNETAPRITIEDYHRSGWKEAVRSGPIESFDNLLRAAHRANDSGDEARSTKVDPISWTGLGLN